MIKNLWAVTKVFCDNHSTPIEMCFKTGLRSVFYGCPEYNNKYTGKKACPNRISTEDLEAVLNIIAQKIEEEEADGGTIDLTGWRFTHKRITCRILRYQPSCIHIAILNGKTFGYSGKK